MFNFKQVSLFLQIIKVIVSIDFLEFKLASKILIYRKITLIFRDAHSDKFKYKRPLINLNTPLYILEDAKSLTSALAIDGMKSFKKQTYKKQENEEKQGNQALHKK